MSITIAACCATPRPRVIAAPVPPCLATLAPVVPEGVEPFSAAWAASYVDLLAYVAAAERSCAPHLIYPDRGRGHEENATW